MDTRSFQEMIQRTNLRFGLAFSFKQLLYGFAFSSKKAPLTARSQPCQAPNHMQACCHFNPLLQTALVSSSPCCSAESAVFSRYIQFLMIGLLLYVCEMALFFYCILSACHRQDLDYPLPFHAWSSSPFTASLLGLFLLTHTSLACASTVSAQHL